MATYKESIVSGSLTSWQRCNKITIENPYNDPSAVNVQFEEEVVKVLPDGEVFRNSCGIMTKVFDPGKIIQIRNPMDWELTGQSITLGEVMALVGSVYWQYALERDQLSK